MKKVIQFTFAVAVCFCLVADNSPVMAQDASHIETATSNDSSDWGLLGLLGLIGLLGLKKKDRDDDTTIDRNR